MKNIFEDIQNNKEVKAITNGIIYDIAQCKSNAIKEIEGLVATSQTTCAGHIASMTRAHINHIKDLLSCKDSAVTNIASFQTKLQGEMKQTMTIILNNNMATLKTKMDATIIEHDARLTVKTEDIKQDIKTSIFLELQQEQDKIKKELSDEMSKTKDKLLIDITAGVNTHIISEVADLRQEIINKQKLSSLPPPQHDFSLSHESFEENEADKARYEQYQKYEQYEKATPTKFLGKHPIDILGGDRPLLNPRQFQYPFRTGQPVTEVESYKFQKAIIQLRCTGPDTIFTFYENLRHIAGSFNILLRPLDEVTKVTGVCLITPLNCLGYSNVKTEMSTAIYLKLSSMEYFKSYPQANAYVRAASATSDGFRLIYRILELVHPRLRQSKGGIHKTITIPAYKDITDDSIYTFLNQYKNYLLYENLSPESREYNKTEQTMFIINALRHDERLRPGLHYVESTLQAYQKDKNLNPSIKFPLELDFDEIGVLIDERSDDYIVGANTALPKFNDLAHKVSDSPVIHALHRKSSSYQRQDNKHDKNKRDYKPTRDKPSPIIVCKACLGVGHCVTKGHICYILAKATICNSFMSVAENKDAINRNVIEFKQERKEKAYKAKTSSRMNGMIHKMYEDGSTMEQLSPIINLAQALNDGSDNEYESSDSSTSDDM